MFRFVRPLYQAPRRVLGLRLGLTLVAVLLAVASSGRPATAFTPTSGTGGTIGIANPTVMAGSLRLPVTTSAAIDPYYGFQVTLSYDTNLLSYSSYDPVG